MSKAFLDHFEPLNIAVITISDTRDEQTDTSGATLKELLCEQGHRIAEKIIIKDDLEKIRSVVQSLSQNHNIEAIITTGGTGFTKRDNTFEAIYPIITKHINGFGEIFRMVSYKEIGTSAMQSNAFAGFVGKTIVFCIPGSTGACKTAFNEIFKQQLDSTTRPCNFSALIKLNYN